jgi:hypothetical protein
MSWLINREVPPLTASGAPDQPPLAEHTDATLPKDVGEHGIDRVRKRSPCTTTRSSGICADRARAPRDWPSIASGAWSGPLQLSLLNGFFVAQFLGLAWLFGRAAHGPPTGRGIAPAECSGCERSLSTCEFNDSPRASCQAAPSDKVPPTADANSSTFVRATDFDTRRGSEKASNHWAKASGPR